MQEEVKAELQEPGPVVVEREVPLLSVTLVDVHKEVMEECRSPKVHNERANRINVEAAEVENSNVDATAIKRRIKGNRKVIKRKPTLKKQRCFRLVF
jgi:hypothetical protein